MSTPPPITGIAEIVLSVRDLPAMRAFYTDTLGFKLQSEHSIGTDAGHDPNGEPTITFLTIRDQGTDLARGGHPVLLALIDYQRHANARKRLSGHDVMQSTLNHLAFEIPTTAYDNWWQRLTGCELDPQPASFPHMNATALFFQDPEGNQLELICHARSAQ